MDDARATDGYSVRRGLLILLGGLMLVAVPLHGWWLGRQAQDWLAVQAVVLESATSRPPSRSTSGERGEPALRFKYSYEVEGRTHRSRRVTAQAGGVPARDREAFARRHPVGSTLMAYHDPKHPSESVIRRDARRLNLPLVLLGGALVALGLLLTWLGLTGRAERLFDRLGLGYR